MVIMRLFNKSMIYLLYFCKTKIYGLGSIFHTRQVAALHDIMMSDILF